MTDRHRPLHIELLAGPDLMDGPPASVLDVLVLVNLLATVRGAAHPPVAWQWTTPDGRALRRPGSPARRVAVPDVVVVPGWKARDGPHLNRLVRRDRSACARLRAVHAAGGQLLAVYNGVALLAEAGLLAGREAVVPWPFIPSVLRHAAGLRLAAGLAWVEDQRLWTGDSPSLTTELILRVLQACGMADLAEAGRSVLLHSPERQGLAKALAQDSVRQGPGALELALRWLEDHLDQPYSLADTARAASVSTRSLLRHFRLSHGMTPLAKLHEMRITQARMLLETTHLPIEQIAEHCGWRDVAMLRRVFCRVTTMTPAAYRERFRLLTVRRQWGRDLAR